MRAEANKLRKQAQALYRKAIKASKESDFARLSAQAFELNQKASAIEVKLARLPKGCFPKKVMP
jgi:hypothetical protein